MYIKNVNSTFKCFLVLNNTLKPYDMLQKCMDKLTLMIMGYLKCIMLVVAVILISSSCCVFKKSLDECKIKEINFTAVNENCYSMNIIFSHSSSKELRMSIAIKKIGNRFPLIRNNEIQVQEYLGELYNQYKYEVKFE